MGTVSRLNQNVTGLLVVTTSFYVIFFVLYHLYAPLSTADTFIHKVFISPIYIIPIFIIFAATFINFGKILAHDNVEIGRNRALRDVRRKEQQLIDYVRLAQIITKGDAKTLVKNYLDKLEQEELKDE